MMVSGAAEPNAMNDAPATSSRTFHHTHSVSRLVTRWLSAMMPREEAMQQRHLGQHAPPDDAAVGVRVEVVEAGFSRPTEQPTIVRGRPGERGGSEEGGRHRSLKSE